ncbi:MAG TPA: hypothetical protein VFV25_02455 [Methylibium sp.]
MGPLDALNHLVNFFMPALGVGLISALLAKLLWYRSLKGVGWLRLAGWSTAACALVSVVGLVLSGRDGRMLTYVAMAAGCALALLWAGWGRR